MDIPILSTNRSFNPYLYLRESHNCYSYMLNLKSPEAIEACKKEYKNANYCRRSQPGYAAGYPPLYKRDLTCKKVMKRTLADNPNIKPSTFTRKCPQDSYKGALVVDPGNDYHYYRQNDDGYWTHKPGYKPSTGIDASGKLITNPEKANRNYGRLNYSDFCGHFCVPRLPDKKRMYYQPLPSRKRSAMRSRRRRPRKPSSNSNLIKN